MKGISSTAIVVLLVGGLVACAPSGEDMAGDATETPAEEVGSGSTVAESTSPAAQRPAAPSAATAQAPAPRAQTSAPTAQAPAAPQPRVFEVPQGTTLAFTLIDALSTETSQPGDTFEASLSEALVIDGVTLVPRNAMASGRVLAVTQPGRVQGRARIELAMTEIRVGDAVVAISTAPLVAEAESTRTEDATKIGVGAGIGAAIGGILGGGKGAATGAAIGGGTGTGVVLATRGDQIEYPSETRLDFTLAAPVSIREGGTS